MHELRARGLSYPDIARLLDLSVGTVWNYANR
ncbi:MAG: helix-turn-helix domain-containing protein [Chloroflexi bacterium]|nr:helix-turn-helix domain-containing protein [Chloroflexota bacterium]